MERKFRKNSYSWAENVKVRLVKNPAFPGATLTELFPKLDKNGVFRSFWKNVRSLCFSALMTGMHSS